jgi:hypothetical protein
VVAHKAAQLNPTQEDETADVLRRRLFEKVDIHAAQRVVDNPGDGQIHIASILRQQKKLLGGGDQSDAPSYLAGIAWRFIRALTDRNFERRPSRWQPYWPVFRRFAIFCLTFPARFPLVLGLGGACCRIPVCFMVQSSSGTGSADGPMDFAVRDELPWIPSREEAALKPRRSGPLVGVTGTRSSSTNCSSPDRCVPDWPNSAAMNSLFEHQFQVAWLVGDLWRSPGRASGAGRRAERALRGCEKIGTGTFANADFPGF